MEEKNFGTADLYKLKAILDDSPSNGRSDLLPYLQKVQDFYGFIPEDAAKLIAEGLKIPLADIYGVIEFYTLLSSKPIGKTILHLCNDPVCAMAGSDTVFKTIQKKYETKSDGLGNSETVVVEKAPCLGLCEHAPAVFIQGEEFSLDSVDTGETWQDMVGMREKYPRAKVYGENRILTRNCGRSYSTNLIDYVENDGYKALKKVLTLPPASVIEEVKSSGLLGRGGAAFPTGIKWEGAAKASGNPKYVVCNADEAEPGTFKDRVMMEDDPHRVIEGLIIAGYAIGATKGFFYIRGEYRIPYQEINRAVKDAENAGFLGKNILGSGFDFQIEIRQGAGAYICGEETALFESIEGKRGFPRVKPPFPTTHGLFGKPTVINNVETLSNVSTIILYGGDFYRKFGTERSTGTKLFCLSGDITNPGLYEIPFGMTLRKLVFDLAGGIPNNHNFFTALVGGAAGAFAAESQLDTPLTFDDLRSAGLTLGSGVITVMDDTRDIKDIINRLGRFFADESCGKCFPCQLGTKRQAEILQRVLNGNTLPGDDARLKEIGATMTDASICGLGQTAASAVLSALKHWPQLFQPLI